MRQAIPMVSNISCFNHFAGYINLGVAENMLCSAEMAQLLNKVKNVTPTTFGYGDFRGSLTLRTQLASLFAKNIFKTSEPIDADHFYMCNGAGSVVEQVCASLGDAGDLIMIPAPMFVFSFFLHLHLGIMALKMILIAE